MYGRNAAFRRKVLLHNSSEERRPGDENCDQYMINYQREHVSKHRKD